MSMSALLTAVESRIRTALSDSAGDVAGVKVDGHPPAFAGQWYYAIHSLEGSGSQESPLSDDRYYGIGVTITAKIAYAPNDRRGSIAKASGELFDRADAIAVLLHGDYTSMNAANVIIGAEANGFIEPLNYLGGAEGPIQEQGPEWVHAKMGVKGERVGALVLALRFGRARRIRVLP